MEYLPILLTLFAVDMLAAMSPGANFIVVTRAAIERERSYANAVVLGIVAANLVWCSAVALGLSAIFELSPWLYRLIKFLGGTYLVYLGIILWRSSGDSQTHSTLSFQKSLSSAFLRGLLTNLSNPKSVVYFASVFSIFMGPDSPHWVRLAAVSIVIADTLLWYGSVAMVFSSKAVQHWYRRMQLSINRLSGVVMAAFGIRLILDSD